jgi:iron complex outermembrane receptor protein
MKILLKRLLLFSMAAMCFLNVMAQEKKTVTGTVKDAEGTPLASVTIQEKGTTNQTTTGANGAFRITVAPNATLVFTSIGFEAREESLNGRNAIEVSLDVSSKEIGEVVVTSLGITREKKALGYASSTIKAEDITQAGSPNFAAALYGKAPGVRIGATPGGATSAVNINIRGINSITGKNQPLIVMDGVPIRNEEVRNNDYWNDQRLRGNGLLDINPEDIENISILKGASAAALYGSEALNGVILITTKKGSKSNKGFSVDFNANYSMDQVAYLPRYQNVRGAGAPLHVSNAGQDAEGFVYWDTNGDGIKETRGITAHTINFGPKFDGKPTIGWDGVVRPYEAQKDNYGGLFQTGRNSSVNVAISQSSANATTRFSITRQQNQGISIGAENTKNIANLNTSLKLGKKFTTDVIVNFINQHTHNRPYSIDRMINNFTGMIGRFDNADWYLDKYKTSKGYRFVTGTNQSLTPAENIIYNGFKGDIADYVWRVKEHNEDEYSNRVIGSVTNTWQVVKDLRFRARFSTDLTSMRSESKQSTEIPLSFGNSGYFGMNSYQNNILYGDALLTYTKQINSDIELNVMGGYTATKETQTILGRGTNGGLSTENLFDIAASVNTANSSSGRFSMVRDAIIGTANASYKDFLFVEATVRRDRTSTMHPSHNSFVYPSINSSFILSDAVTLPSFVTYAKLRASWGVVGGYPEIYGANIAFNQNTLGVQSVGGQPVLYTTIPSNFGNDAIKPEEKHEIEFGIEARFFKNRLNFEASYYNGQIRDQILPLTIPASSGATSVLTNIGTLRNQGIEVAISGSPVVKKNFKWETGVNFSQNKNVVEKLSSGSTELLHADYDGNAAQLKSVVGQAMGDFYAHPVLTNNKGEQVVGSNGLYSIDPNNMIKVGNAMPKVIGGFFNTLTYKNFNLDVLTDFRFGGYVMPTGIYWMISRGLLEESLNNMDQASGGLSYYVNAQGKGVQTTGTTGPNGEKVLHDGMLMGGVTADGQKNTNVISQAYYYWNTYNWGGPQYSYSRYELYIQKNSYVKLREISLSYTLPEKASKFVGARKIQLSAFGRNLFYLYRTIKDMDAEQTTAGSRWFQTLNNAGTNPSTRSYGVMIRANF